MRVQMADQQKRARLQAIVTNGKKLEHGKSSGEQEVVFEEALEMAGYGTYNHLLLMTGIVCAMSHQGNTAMLSYLLPAAECDLELTPLRKGTITAVPYAGMMFSALLWGFLSDTLGRRRLLLFAYLADGICSVLSAFTQSYWFLLMLRFCGGLIVCGPMGIQKTYLTEFHVQAKRPVVMMWTGVFVAIANVYFPMLAWAILPLSFEWHPVAGFKFNSWRLFVLMNSLPSFLSIAAISLFSESPKFLLSSGKHDEALGVLRKMYRWNKRQDPRTFPVRRLRPEGVAAAAVSPSAGTAAAVKLSPALALLRAGWLQAKPLFLLPHRPRAILTFVLQMFTLLGMNTLRLWVPQLFSSIEEYHHAVELRNATRDSTGVSLCEMLAQARPHALENASALGTQGALDAVCSVALLENTVYIRAAIVGAATGCAFLAACFLIQFTGKRGMMVGCFVVGGAAGVAMYWGSSDADVLALSATYVALTGVSHTVALSVVVELFPTQLRNMAVNLTLFAGQLGTVVGNIAFPVLLEADCVLLFFLFGAVALICAVLCLFIPKTKNLQVLE